MKNPPQEKPEKVKLTVIKEELQDSESTNDEESPSPERISLFNEKILPKEDDADSSEDSLLLDGLDDEPTFLPKKDAFMLKDVYDDGAVRRKQLEFVPMPLLPEVLTLDSRNKIPPLPQNLQNNKNPQNHHNPPVQQNPQVKQNPQLQQNLQVKQSPPVQQNPQVHQNPQMQ